MKNKRKNKSGEERKRTKRTERKLAERNAGASSGREYSSSRQGCRTHVSSRAERTEVERSNSSNDYIYGINPVKEALKSDRSINSILIASGDRNRQVHEIITEAKSQKIPVKEVPQSKLNLVSDTKNHQGVVAYVAPINYYGLHDVLNDTKNSDVIIALDGITDVHNLGAIMRTIDAAGFRYVMIPERRSAQLNSTVAKTSAGAIEFVRTVRVSSLSNSIKELQKNGYWVVGADLKGNTDYRKVDYKGKIVIVIGSESKGISPSILKLCDFNVKIPMQGRINSLNASVSASILIYEALRNRA